MKQKQRCGNGTEGVAQFVTQHRQELVFGAVGLRKTVSVGLQGLLDTGKFARGHANHLVEVLDDHSPVARTEEMVRLQCLQNDFLKDVKFQNQLFQRVRGLVRPLLAMNGQIRQVPRGCSRVCLVAQDFRHYFKHLSEAVAKDDFRGPRRWGHLSAYTVIPPLHNGRYQIEKPLGRKILRHGASRSQSPHNLK